MSKLPDSGNKELASKVLLIQAKKFYLDVKENRRGRLVKISEVGANGHKNHLVLDMAAATEFHEHLTNFSELYMSLGPRSRGLPGDLKIKSEVIYSADRRYYLDLKENNSGRFLKIAMTFPPPCMDRKQIMIPAQGMVDIRDVLTDFLSEYGSHSKIELGRAGAVPETSESAMKLAVVQPSDRSQDERDNKLSLQLDNKTFFIEICHSQDGECLRISDVSPSFRTAINIPRQFWSEFKNKLIEIGCKLAGSTEEPTLQQTDATESADAVKSDFVGYYKTETTADNGGYIA